MMNKVTFIEQLSEQVNDIVNTDYSTFIQEYLDLNEDRIGKTVNNTISMRGQDLSASEVEVLFEVIEKLYENFNELLHFSAKNVIETNKKHAEMHETLLTYLKSNK